MRATTLKLIQSKPVFGFLTLTSAFEVRIDSKNNKTVWVEAVCACGKKKYFNLSEIKRGRIKSCGCMRDKQGTLNLENYHKKEVKRKDKVKKKKRKIDSRNNE